MTSKLVARLASWRDDPLSGLLGLAMILGTVFTMVVLATLISMILIQGIPNLTASLFDWNYTSTNASMAQPLLNTIACTLVALLAALLPGIGAAIYLSEYASRRGFFVRAARTMTETLAGIPSIIYGLFGFLFFVTELHMGYSLLAGALTLALMILPVIIRTSEEALRAIPASWREASMALGAGRTRTVFEVVLPAAAPGILAGVILGAGRAMGETAALIFTAGTVASFPDSVVGPGRTISVHVWALVSEGLFTRQAAAAAVVLLALTLLVNLAARAAARAAVTVRPTAHL